MEPAIQVKMWLIETCHDQSPLRTKEVYGVAFDEPMIGECFQIFSEPLTPGSEVRVVTTSPVQRIRITDKGNFLIYTKNSVYEIEKVPLS